MSIEYSVEAAPGGGRGALLRVRCTDEQAQALSGIISHLFPGRRSGLLPMFGTDFTYGCTVPGTPQALRQKWTTIEMQLLLGPSARKREHSAPPSLPPKPATPSLAGTSRESDSASARPTGGLGGTSSEGPAANQRLNAMDIELARLSPLPAATRRGPLQRLYDPADPSTVAAGILLAATYGELGESAASAALYAKLEAQAPCERRRELRERLVQAWLVDGKDARVRQLVAADEPSGLLRGCLGVALYRAGELEASLPHLAYAWQTEEGRIEPVALPLARLAWKRGDFHAAAAPYRLVIETTPVDLLPKHCTREDFAAVVELARCGEYDDLPDDRLLACIFALRERASAAERATDDAHQTIVLALNLARRLGDPSRLAHAYRLMIDDLLERRQGRRLVELIQEAQVDQHQGLLTVAQRFDLLDELADSLMDYRQLLRQPLVEGFANLLGQMLDHTGDPTRPLAAEARDIYRSLYDLDRRNPFCERYRTLAGVRQSLSPAAASEEAAPIGLAGKRIAIVGGHESTRLHVRARLQGWGVRVDEVPPPTAGRSSEREILDRVRLSDLVVMVVGYMGHDMSTIVGNLAARKALAGQVLAVDCRGASGVTRAIVAWSEGGQH